MKTRFCLDPRLRGDDKKSRNTEKDVIPVPTSRDKTPAGIQVVQQRVLYYLRLLLCWKFAHGRIALFGILILCSLICQGCGYHRAMPVNPLLQNISTIAVPYFKNKTFEPGLESIFTQAFVNEFIESKRLRVVSREQADVILYGTIKKLLEDTLAYDRDDKAQEYRLRVNVDLVLEERQTGKVVWKRTNLQHAEEHTVDARIIATETIKREALQRLAQDLAERVHDSIMQGF